MISFLIDHKWKAAGLLLIVQAWLATDFFKRASFGVAVDGALLLGSVLLVLAVVLYACSWLIWYVREVVRWLAKKVAARGAVGCSAGFGRSGKFARAKG